MSIALTTKFDTRPPIKTQEEAIEVQCRFKPRPKQKDSDRKVVCIVGLAAFSRMLAEEMEPTTHIWSLNHGWKVLRCRVDAWFDIHNAASWTQNLTYYSGLTVPVYMQEAHPSIPYSVKYPLDEITEMDGRRFLTSSTAFMLALAIYQGFDEIRLLGNDMDKWSEYSEQRTGVLYWIKAAEARGIEVWLPDGCPLFTEPIYGYENPSSVPRDLLAQFHHEACVMYDNAKVEARGARRYREGIEVVGGDGQALEDARQAEMALLLELNTAGGAVQVMEKLLNNSGAGRSVIPHITPVLTEDQVGEDPKHLR